MEGLKRIENVKNWNIRLQIENKNDKISKLYGEYVIYMRGINDEEYEMASKNRLDFDD